MQALGGCAGKPAILNCKPKMSYAPCVSACMSSQVAHGVSIDSRAIQPGDLFIGSASRGSRNRTATRTLAPLPQQPPPRSCSARPRRFLRRAADFRRRHVYGPSGFGARRATANAKIIAVTGSVGKTGSKDQLRLMPGTRGYVRQRRKPEQIIGECRCR